MTQYGKYVKKPVVIDAIKFEDPVTVMAWACTFDDEIRWKISGERIIIQTLEGDMTALPGDWIIRGVKGEFYPCKPDIFDETYEIYREKIELYCE
jgi:hypothetical protein